VIGETYHAFVFLVILSATLRCNIILAILILLLYWPITYQPLVTSRPAQSYEEAVTRIAAFTAADERMAVYPGCASQFLSHGQKVEQVIVLLHGYRNCPKQYQQLGQQFYELGYNVLIPRMPHMGLADVMSPDQANLKAEELTVYATEAVDIAQGLGDEVTVVGISTGGILTGWVTQTRTDVARTVLIAPVFGLHAIPAQLTTPVVNFCLIAPNFFLWQDAELKADIPNPKQVYPQNSTRALSEILRISYAIQAAARQSSPAVPSIIVVTNANDDAVDNQVIANVVASWRNTGFENLQTYEFQADLKLDHDLLDPEHPKQKVDLAYPVLMELITK
jgi:carboxylesterase